MTDVSLLCSRGQGEATSLLSNTHWRLKFEGSNALCMSQDIVTLEHSQSDIVPQCRCKQCCCMSMIQTATGRKLYMTWHKGFHRLGGKRFPNDSVASHQAISLSCNSGSHSPIPYCWVSPSLAGSSEGYDWFTISPRARRSILCPTPLSFKL